MCRSAGRHAHNDTHHDARRRPDDGPTPHHAAHRATPPPCPPLRLRHTHRLVAEPSVPHRALPKGFGGFLDLIRLRALRSPSESAGEVRKRTALRREGDVRLYYSRLRAARDATGSLADLLRGAAPVEQRWWRASAFVDVLWGELAAGAGATGGRRAERPGRGVSGAGTGASGRIRAAAVALRPRLRRWLSARSIGSDLLDRAVSRALLSISRCAPAFGVALVRTWTHAWATSQRHGELVMPCRACGKCGGDDVHHVVRCAPMWAEVCRQSGLSPPSSIHDALALRHSAAAPGVSRGGRQRPRARIMGRLRPEGCDETRGASSLTFPFRCF